MIHCSMEGCKLQTTKLIPLVFLSLIMNNLIKIPDDWASHKEEEEHLSILVEIVGFCTQALWDLCNSFFHTVPASHRGPLLARSVGNSVLLSSQLLLWSILYFAPLSSTPACFPWMISGNFHCTVKNTVFNCSRPCLPPRLAYNHCLFQLFSAACKNPSGTSVNFPGSGERRDFYCRQESENTSFLAQRSRIVNLAWCIALFLANTPSLLSILVGTSEPGLFYQGRVYPQLMKAVETRTVA